MTNHVIPESAVEAAAKAVFLTGYPEGCGVSWDPTSNAAWLVMRDIRTALEAAAPHMLAKAWDEGMEAMYDTTSHEWPPIPEQNPYRSQA
jgi:hypothetical protein